MKDICGYCETELKENEIDICILCKENINLDNVNVNDNIVSEFNKVNNIYIDFDFKEDFSEDELAFYLNMENNDD